MKTVKKAKFKPFENLTDRTMSDSVKLEGRALLERGAEVSIRGQRGRFRFISHTAMNSGVEWVTVFGPVTGDGQRAQWRSFDVCRIKSVHRVGKARPAR